VIIGKTKSGKSTIGNVILRRSGFPVGGGIDSVTKIPEAKRIKITQDNCEYNVTLMDTPGFFDTMGDFTNSSMAKRIKDETITSMETLNLLIFVFNGATPLSPEEKQAFAKIKEIYDDEMISFTAIVITHVADSKQRNLLLTQLRNNHPDIYKLAGKGIYFVDFPDEYPIELILAIQDLKEDELKSKTSLNDLLSNDTIARIEKVYGDDAVSKWKANRESRERRSVINAWFDGKREQIITDSNTLNTLITNSELTISMRKVESKVQRKGWRCALF